MYAPLNIPDGQNIYGYKPTEQVYNVLDNSASRSEAPLQSGPVGIEQPVYNILEELPNHQEDTLQSDPVSIEQPVYNILEELPNHQEDTLQSDPVSIEQPVYNILEELPNHQEDTLQSVPVSTEQPVYNILEELPIDRENTPSGTEPVYNVMEANGQGDTESSGDNGSLPSEGKIHNPLQETKHVEDCSVKRDNEAVYNVLEQDHYQKAY